MPGLLEALNNPNTFNNPLLNFGTGLLAASGPSPVPIGFGQALALGAQNVQRGQQQLLTNQLLRSRLSAEKQARDEANRRREAYQALFSQPPQEGQAGFGVMANSGQQAPIQGLLAGNLTPETLGLLGQAAPEQMSAGLLGNLFKGTEPATYKGALGELFDNRDLANMRGDTAAAAAFEDAIKRQLGPNLNFDDISKARNDVIKNSSQFLAAQQGYERVKVGALAGTPAGDVGLVYGFMKVLDPQSVVRESEFATAENTAGVPEQIRGLYNKLLTGERLTPEQRADFLSQAKQQYKSVVEQQNKLVGDYRDFATRRNLPASDVIPSFVVPGKIGNETPAPSNPNAAREKAASETKKLFQEVGLSGVGQTVSDILKMGMDEIRSIDTDKIKSWSQEKRDALDKRLKELGY